MIKELKTYIQSNGLFTQEDRILVACSGGVDSAALAKALHELGHDIALAHCNYQLRGKDSDLDQEFVEAFAMKLGVPCYTVSFETTSIAEAEKKGIQETARNLRYQWFEEIATTKGFDRIATAHHQDDQVETTLFHLLRGANWKGLSGMDAQRGRIVRPLLGVSKSDILHFAKANQLDWREDSSNDSKKYSRNRIRHELIPLLDDIRPGFKKNILRRVAIFKEIDALLDEFLEQLNLNLLELTAEGVLIFIDELEEMEYKRLWMSKVARDYGFDGIRVDEILRLAKAEQGKALYSETHRIVKERDMLMITAIPNAADTKEYLIHEESETMEYPIMLEFETKLGAAEVVKNKDIGQFDWDKLAFPLILRKWKTGDRIRPLGLNGSQLISDILQQSKANHIQKENTWVIENAGEIIWVIGLKISDSTKITSRTQKTFSIHRVNEN